MKYRRKKKKWKIRLIAAVVALVAAVGFLSMRNNAKRVVLAMSEARVRAMTTTSINLAIYETLNGVAYSDLMTVEKNEAGEVVLLSANAAQINRVARDTAFLSQENLERLGTQGIDVPLGAFTGSEIFAGFGPDVTIKIIPVGSVNCSFFSDYQSVGINQTLHRIYMEAKADVDIVLPGYSLKVTVPTQVFVCESILVGKVPQTYLNADGWGKKYEF